MWGEFVDLIDTDEEFARLWMAIAREFCDLLNMPDARRSVFLKRFSDQAPVLMGFQGLSEALSSRKLLRSLDACFEDPTFLGNAAGSVMGALMGYDIHEPGWVNYFVRVQKEHGRIMAVSGAMCDMAEATYYGETLGDDDTSQLLTFLVAHYSQSLNQRSAADRKKHEARIAQKLRRNRILMRARRAGLPAKTIEGEVDPFNEELNPADARCSLASADYWVPVRVGVRVAENG
jgi:hypothetical protein